MAKKKSSLVLEDAKVNIKIKLSALWASLMFLYIYADFLSLYKPGELIEVLQGKMGPFEVSQTTLLAASFVVIIPALMVFLSLMLKAKWSRWINIAFGAVFTLINISNLVGEGWAYYILFGVLEIGITLAIFWLALKWPTSSAGSK